VSLKKLDLEEWGRGHCPGVRLGAVDRDLAERLRKRPLAARVDVKQYGDTVAVEAAGAVGVVRFEQFELRIHPKLAEGHLGLVRLIRYLSGLRELSALETFRDMELSGVTLVELTALLLVEATDAVVRQGLWADYVEREEDLAVLRGRLMFDRQWRRRYGLLDRLECRFDEHELNIRENRLLGVALRASARILSHPGIAGRASALSDLFETVCDLDEDPLPALLEPFEYHRMNEHYEVAHELARLVIEGLGPDDILLSGDARCFAFLLDMNSLFERFVAQLLRSLLKGVEIRVESQRQDSIVRRAESGKRYGNIRPDILLTSRPKGRRLPVDSKWKRYDARRVDSGDIAQMFLYAYAYGAAERMPAALLLYPTETEEVGDTPLIVRSVEHVKRARISILGVPVRVLLQELEGTSAETPAVDELCATVSAEFQA
jgi:5-methylcytosine-specific restriction enzyme subunit McrC